jgi:hypothetical protein
MTVLEQPDAASETAARRVTACVLEAVLAVEVMTVDSRRWIDAVFSTDGVQHTTVVVQLSSL